MNAANLPLAVRPYQLLCLVCSMGDGEPGPADPELRRIVDAVRAAPDRPLTIGCNAGDVYAYQDPGTAADTPEGAALNRKRDLDVLQRMDWPPGITLPARTALQCLLARITDVQGICGYETTTANAWRGCSRARSGCYARGCQRGIEALIPPPAADALAREKERSLAALAAAREVPIRPHILLCAVCQYGSGVRPPYAEDNLPELLDLVLHRNPDIPITMARGADWLMCAPCPRRVPALNACTNVLGSGGLSNEKRDLDTLQVLGLDYGSSMPARELFGLIFTRIPSTAPICRREANRKPSVWWDGCGEANLEHGHAGYERGRRELMAALGMAAE